MLFRKRVGFHKGNRLSAFTHPSRTPYPVRVHLLRIRLVVIYHVRNSIHMDSARGNIGRNKDPV